MPFFPTTIAIMDELPPLAQPASSDGGRWTVDGDDDAY